MELTTLPFDQYGRYRMIADALDAVRPALGGRLRILDVGGYFRSRRGVELLPARAFLPDDDVLVLDRPACALPGYLQGDGRELAFDDNAFDLVISCDTLEHVPSADRPGFWNELLRVARLGVALIAPCRTPATEAAEQLVLSYIRAELGQEQPQLTEHRAYGLPDPLEVAVLIERLGLRQRNFPSGVLHGWVAMMIARHTRPICDDPDFGEQLDAYYTRFLAADDRCEPAYRRLWLVEKQGLSGWFDLACAALDATVRTTPPGTPGWPELIGWQLQIAGLRASGGYSELIERQAERIRALEQERDWRAGQVAALERHVAWLERKAVAASDELARIRQGRMLRLLRRLGGDR